ncbi:TRAP transporter large permease subunit [Roseobacter sp. YSTF-M11]|uniref:TRAP transporter large permease subunit n=1 Tax=Roseobacter insulae TaxID=2859783 RepID=A0A9X1FYR6_9RHOB|nr:TRAP transporter large permease subunit [Roseobacter insulae]
MGITIPVLGLLIVLVFAGVHIAVSLAITSLLGLFLITGSLDITIATFASTAFQGLRGYVFAALPLFMLMGEFISRSGAAQDLYVGINRSIRAIPGRLALATVLGNAVFAFLTGVSIAAAAAFTRIAYPQMLKLGYDRGVALGVIAGSSCLGMLIPPSNLMILWAILVEESIGRLFLAGILPGLMLAGLFLIYVLLNAWFRPHLYGEGPTASVAEGEPQPRSLSAAASGDDLQPSPLDTVTSRDVFISGICMGGLIAAVLGGIWFGAFTATEAAGVGALLALIFAIAVKRLGRKDIFEGILQVGKTAAPLMIMILMALLYSRTLALTGIGGSIEDFFGSGVIPPWAVLVFMVCIWFILGMLIDSKSIMLLTVPIFAPLGELIGYDPIAFAIIGILAIEAGILTPPFGLIVYTVKAAANDDKVSTLRIFGAATPYWICLLIVLVAVAIWPELATGLGDMVFG